MPQPGRVEGGFSRSGGGNLRCAAGLHGLDYVLVEGREALGRQRAGLPVRVYHSSAPVYWIRTEAVPSGPAPLVRVTSPVMTPTSSVIAPPGPARPRLHVIGQRNRSLRDATTVGLRRARGLLVAHEHVSSISVSFLFSASVTVSW